jgi:RNA polymerase sigma factor (sigma-70 family)
VTTNHDGWLTQRFEENRRHLSAVAYRMLGSASEAEDAVQEAWLSLRRPGAAEIDNLGGWLTSVVARVCLDMLRSRRSRLEVSLDEQPSLHDVESSNPEEDALFARIRWGSPCSWFSTRSRRRSASRSSCTTCSRCRSRRSPRSSVVHLTRRDSSRAVRVAALLAVLDPDVVLQADEAAVAMGSPTLVRGARSVAETFVGRARAARPMLVDGLAGLVWFSEGRPRVVFECRVSAEAIVEISMIADPDRLAELQLAPLD